MHGEFTLAWKSPSPWGSIGHTPHSGQKGMGVEGVLDFRSESGLWLTGSWGSDLLGSAEAAGLGGRQLRVFPQSSRVKSLDGLSLGFPPESRGQGRGGTVRGTFCVLFLNKLLKVRILKGSRRVAKFCFPSGVIFFSYNIEGISYAL